LLLPLIGFEFGAVFKLLTHDAGGDYRVKCEYTGGFSKSHHTHESKRHKEGVTHKLFTLTKNIIFEVVVCAAPKVYCKKLPSWNINRTVS
jgi:hypothetical protein